jgi:hypothetical protein
MYLSGKFELKHWQKGMDLSFFYEEAAKRGFENNASEKMLIGSISKEPRWAVWILFYDEKPVGSVAAHSLSMFGPNAYRICARTCVLTDQLPIRTMRSLGHTVKKHQNITGQFFIPQCIAWAGEGADLYISTNSSPVASQEQVHRIYCPALESTGALSNSGEHFYRGHNQTFWKLNVKTYLEQLHSLPRWDCTFDPVNVIA